MITLGELIKEYKPHEVDFVFPSKDDTPVYIDLNLLYHSPETRWHKVQALIYEYFNRYLNSYREGAITSDELEAALEFPEVSHIALGYCKNGKNGRGGAEEKAIAIKNEIFDNETVHEVGVEALAKMSIVIPKVGPDTLSDLVANFGISYLIQYTEEQVKLYGLKTTDIQIERALDPFSFTWRPIPRVRLPYFEEDGFCEPRIFVPKHLVRKIPIFSPEGFYQNYLRYFLKHEEEQRIITTRSIGKKPKVSLKQVENDLKSRFGKKTAAIRKIAKNRPELVADYVGNPNIFDDERRKKRKKGKENWSSYIEELKKIPSGKGGASRFSEFLRKIFTALYDGHLTSGTREDCSVDGIFRYDVVFGNGANTPLFKMIRNQQIKSGLLVIEAKNYDSSRISNDEFNQGRAYTLANGRELVFLISRKEVQDKDIERARRHFLAQRCLIFPIGGGDLIEMIRTRKEDPDRFDEFLVNRLKKILQA